MTRYADVVVIGGGIAGAAVAAALAGPGRRLTLLERGPGSGAATDASAGMLAAQIEARAGDALLPLALAARDCYDRLLASLPVDVAHRLAYRPTGILHVALTDEEAAGLAGQADAQRALGLEAQWLDQGELRRRHPAIAPAARGALLTPRDGCIHNAALAAALRATAFAHGAHIVTAAASQVLARRGTVTAVRSSAGTWRARWVVVAAGAWSPLLRGLPRPLPVEPVRGQMLLVAAPDGWREQVVFGPRGYVVPREGRALLGSTMERAGFDATTTPAGLAQVRAAAAELIPALAGAPALASWAGLRPMTPDGLPILGRDPDLDGLLYATGHGRNGILLGPLTGELIRDLVVRGETAVDIAPYGVARFERRSKVEG